MQCKHSTAVFVEEADRGGKHSAVFRLKEQQEQHFGFLQVEEMKWEPGSPVYRLIQRQ